MNTTRQSIEENRTSEVELTVKGADGQPLAGREVTVRMTRHNFLFGCNAYYLNPDGTDERRQAYQQQFADLFNYATLSFYWGRYEPEDGKVEEENRRSQAEWLRDHGIVSKGHPLAWYIVQPEWVPQDDPDLLWEMQKKRCARDTAAFAETIDIWDVLNEMARIKDGIEQDHIQIDKNFRRMWEHIGPVEMIKGCFEAAAEGNPDAKLILNDYDLTDTYVKIIEDCLEAGVKIDIIGIQSHWHAGTVPAEEQDAILERFSKFGIPLHFTEATIISGEHRGWEDLSQQTDWHTTPEGEERQEREVVDFYSRLFAHPLVEAITWWDFPDGCWRGAPSGLVRKDMAPKPAYESLMRLVKGEWWTPEQTLTTDEQGVVRFRAFLGEYEVAVGAKRERFMVEQPGGMSREIKVKD